MINADGIAVADHRKQHVMPRTASAAATAHFDVVTHTAKSSGFSRSSIHAAISLSMMRREYSAPLRDDAGEKTSAQPPMPRSAE